VQKTGSSQRHSHGNSSSRRSAASAAKLKSNWSTALVFFIILGGFGLVIGGRDYASGLLHVAQLYKNLIDWEMPGKIVLQSLSFQPQDFNAGNILIHTWLDSIVSPAYQHHTLFDMYPTLMSSFSQ
jgi:hypothetical protein